MLSIPLPISSILSRVKFRLLNLAGVLYLLANPPNSSTTIDISLSYFSKKWPWISGSPQRLKSLFITCLVFIALPAQSEQVSSILSNPFSNSLGLEARPVGNFKISNSLLISTTAASLGFDIYLNSCISILPSLAVSSILEADRTLLSFKVIVIWPA